MRPNTTRVANPSAATSEEERAAVARLKAGDADALGLLYQWYGDRLYRSAILARLPNVEAAEDVLKDTFRLALERIHQYEPRERSIYFWLRRIAINRAMDVHRARTRAQRLEEAVSKEPERVVGEADDDPDEASDRAETRALIEETLLLLNPRYALALRLRLLEDRDRADCASVLGVSVGNFDVILHRAAKAFRAKYPPR